METVINIPWFVWVAGYIVGIIITAVIMKLSGEELEESFGVCVIWPVMLIAAIVALPYFAMIKLANYIADKIRGEQRRRF